MKALDHFMEIVARTCHLKKMPHQLEDRRRQAGSRSAGDIMEQEVIYDLYDHLET
jgi:hypothetical protein